MSFALKRGALSDLRLGKRGCDEEEDQDRGDALQRTDEQRSERVDDASHEAGDGRRVGTVSGDDERPQRERYCDADDQADDDADDQVHLGILVDDVFHHAPLLSPITRKTRNCFLACFV